MIYRNVKIEILANFIRLTNLELTEAPVIKGTPVSEYPNGVKITSIPEPYRHSPILYAKRLIDRTYDWAEYHKANEKYYFRNNGVV